MSQHRIREYMTALPHSIGLDQEIRLASEMMRKYQVRHLPVQEGGKLVGVVSDRDIQIGAALAEERERVPLKNVYIPEPYSVTEDTPLRDVLVRMANDKIGCALVIDRPNGKLVGIFTTTDACRLLAERLT